MEATSSTLRSKVSSLFSSNIENRDLSTKKSPKSNSCASTPTKMMEKPEKGKKLYLDKSVAPGAQVRNQFQHEIFIIYKRCALTSKKLQVRSHNNMMKNPRTKWWGKKEPKELLSVGNNESMNAKNEICTHGVNSMEKERGCMGLVVSDWLQELLTEADFIGYAHRGEEHARNKQMHFPEREPLV